MKHLRQSFLAESVRRIETLREELSVLRGDNKNLAENDALRRIFRQIHTLKGSAAAFELNQLSEVAHEIENLLEARQAGGEQLKINAFLTEGFDELKSALAAAENGQIYALPHEKIERWREIAAADSKKPESQFPVNSILPVEITNQLKKSELVRLLFAFSENTCVFIVAAEFAAQNFAADFKILNQFLNESGEVIALIPGTSETGRIHLQIVYVGNLKQQSLTDFGGKIVFQFPEKTKTTANETPDSVIQLKLSDIWSIPVLAAKKAAKATGKKVVFETVGGDFTVNQAIAEAIEIALIHLLRNAVAHGIEMPHERVETRKDEHGTVKIKANQTNRELRLKVSDDGRGIDLERVKRIAAARNLFDGDLSEKQTLELIFLPNFSTSEKLNHISGRGIGLDAAAASMRAIGGEISVESETGCGTVFELIIKN